MPKTFNRTNGENVSNQRKNGKYVPWVIFAFVIVIILSSLGALTARDSFLETKISKVQEEVSGVVADISNISANIEWIKEALRR